MPRRDRPGVFKSSKLQAELDALALQVPPEMAGMELVSPDIDVHLECPTSRPDRDNILTTILDVLVRMRVLKDDSIAHCNGRIVLHPVVKSEEWRTTVTLSVSTGAP
mgnify:CR=1 FL=1